MNSTGIILTLAYPETIVRLSHEWFSPYLRFFGIGKKDYIRAGHAALVLIYKETGILEYHDYGRYITPEPYGRVRGSDTDHELNFPITAKIQNGTIENLEEILQFLATNPTLTHGEGKLVISVCNKIDYQKARAYITHLQERYFIRYAAFKKHATNCSRFVTDTLIHSVTDIKIKKKLEISNWFTPSTVGNVLLANTEAHAFEVSETGNISKYTGSKTSENRRCFLDKLNHHQPNFIGTLQPKPVDGLYENAQWLSGLGAGAWFELYETSKNLQYRYRRISAHGNIDVDAEFVVDNAAFDYHKPFEFVHYSNCKFFHVEQDGVVFRFERVDV